jgi:hypothetical protein
MRCNMLTPWQEWRECSPKSAGAARARASIAPKSPSSYSSAERRPAQARGIHGYRAIPANRSGNQRLCSLGNGRVLLLPERAAAGTLRNVPGRNFGIFVQQGSASRSGARRSGSLLPLPSAARSFRLPVAPTRARISVLPSAGRVPSDPSSLYELWRTSRRAFPPP